MAEKSHLLSFSGRRYHVSLTGIKLEMELYSELLYYLGECCIAMHCIIHADHGGL